MAHAVRAVPGTAGLVFPAWWLTSVHAGYELVSGGKGLTTVRPGAFGRCRLKKAAARRAISSAGTFSMCWLIQPLLARCVTQSAAALTVELIVQRADHLGLGAGALPGRLCPRPANTAPSHK
jgi:hypothetical protein